MDWLPYWFDRPILLIITHFRHNLACISIQCFSLFFNLLKFFLYLLHRWIWSRFVQKFFFVILFQGLNIFFNCISILYVFFSCFRFLFWLLSFFKECRARPRRPFFLRLFPKLFSLWFVLPLLRAGPLRLPFSPVFSVSRILLNDLLYNWSGLDKVVKARHPHPPLLKCGRIECEIPILGFNEKRMLEFFRTHLDHLLLNMWLGHITLQNLSERDSLYLWCFKTRALLLDVKNALVKVNDKISFWVLLFLK